MLILTGAMRGAGDTLVPMFITLLTLWLIRIPLASVWSDYTGPDGIWRSIPVTWTTGCICAFIYYRTGRWKNKGVVKDFSRLSG
jgi:Na+-driven multidrug efflux pump